MWLILQQPAPDDYVLATGEVHSVREFVEKAFACIDRRLEWKGSGLEEMGVDARDGRILVEIALAISGLLKSTFCWVTPQRRRPSSDGIIRFRLRS
jgi:GDPmannose 4,6-dehydratase